MAGRTDKKMGIGGQLSTHLRREEPVGGPSTRTCVWVATASIMNHGARCLQRLFLREVSPRSSGRGCSPPPLLLLRVFPPDSSPAFSFPGIPAILSRTSQAGTGPQDGPDHISRYSHLPQTQSPG